MYLKIVNAWYFLTCFTSPNHLKAGKCCFQGSVIKTVSDDVTSSSEILEPENTFEGVLTSDVSTQTMHCVSSDKTCQASTKSSKSVGSLRPYSSYNNRRQSDLRTEIVDEIHSLLKSYTLDEEVSGLLEEIVSSWKWQKTFGMTVNKPLRESGEYAFLQKLAKECEDCKQKEVNKATREQTKALV